MKKILGIVGSLRPSGNSEIMIKQISREIGEPHELRLLRLPEFNLKYCNGCYRCLLKERGCVIKDDLGKILDAIADADALILAVPTYFLAAHSCLKVLIDRGISFYAQAETLWGKPAVGVGVAGIEGKQGSTLLDIERFFVSLMAKNKRSVIAYGALPGEAVLCEKNLELARELAQCLFAAKQSSAGPCCNFCGGETFRFEGDKRVLCMLCSESGVMTIMPDGTPAIEMEMSEHPFLSCKEEALKHRDWLVGMVGRFKEKKEELVNIRQDYDDQTLWLSKE